MMDTALVAATARPELQVLLSCARVHLGPAAGERVNALLRHNLDWDFLLRRALAHSVAPLLHWHLNRTPLDTAPQSVRDRLREHFDSNTRHNLFLTGELFKLLKLFDAHSIAAIPYKGPTLAGLAYGNLALRQFGDLDLLLRRTDIPQARALLLAHGYQPDFPLPPNQENAYLDSLCQLPLRHEKTGCLVELHSHVVPRAFAFPLEPEELWQRRTLFSLNGNKMLTLAAEDLLLVLCAHGTKHVWSSLGWICDVAQLLRVQSNLDWAALLERARRLRSQRLLLLGLLLAHDLLQAPLPEDLVHQARANHSVAGLAARVCRRLLGKSEAPHGSWESAAFLVHARERLSDGLGYSLSLAFSPTLSDWQLFSVPRPLFFLYHLVRPFRLIGKYGLQLMQSLANTFRRS
jgi:hypothetical protein